MYRKKAPAVAMFKSAPEINTVRGRLKQRIANRGREKVLAEDRSIKVPKSEAAAYLEWIL